MYTIFALASAPGRAGVAVVRLSGPDAAEIGRSIAGSLPPARQTALRNIRDLDGTVIDRGLVLYFEAPHSFTGEDVVEFHLHGSIAVIQAVLRVLGSFDNAGPAEPGAFTRRALENDRLDLAQVEGLADLIEAETEAQRRQAYRLLAGRLGERVEKWRIDLIRAAALLEATIDFADEEVPVDVTPEVGELITGVKRDLSAESVGTKVAERIRTGFEVAIVGPPNVGKSTLLNTLAGRDAAITSERAGTTRDVIEVRMDLGGLPVILLDTAGLRASDDEVEAIGIQRALDRAESADLRVFLVTADAPVELEPGPDDIVLKAKSDLSDVQTDGISGKTGQGVPELIDSVQSVLKRRSLTVGLATHERHRIALAKAITALENTQSVLAHGADHYDIAAEELRVAIRTLEALIGRVDVENLLDEIFSSFCVGK